MEGFFVTVLTLDNFSVDMFSSKSLLIKGKLSVSSGLKLFLGKLKTDLGDVISFSSKIVFLTAPMSLS